MVLLTDAPSDVAPSDVAEKHLEILYRYKDCFLSQNVLALLMQVLSIPLSRQGAEASLGHAVRRLVSGRERTDDDCKFIELVLHLFKNLLVVPNAAMKEASGGEHLTHMHDDLLAAFHRENVLEMLLIMTQVRSHPQTNPYYSVSQDIREERYSHWGVLVLEMLACMFRHKTAESIVKSARSCPPSAIAPNTVPNEDKPSESAGLKFDPNDPLYALLCQVEHSSPLWRAP